MKDLLKTKKSLFVAAAVSAIFLAGCAVETLNLPIPGQYYPKTAVIGQQQPVSIAVVDGRSRGVLDQNSYMSDYPVAVGSDMSARLQAAMNTMLKARGFTPTDSAANANSKTYMTVTVNDVHLWPAPNTLQRQTRAQIMLTIVAHNMGNSYQQTYTGIATHDSIIPATKEMSVTLTQTAFDQTLNEVYNDQKLWAFLNTATKPRTRWTLS
jgi:uncharacterized lipoprotein YajG